MTETSDKDPKTPRVGRLHTVGAIASELGKLYRRVARGEIESSDGARRATILRELRECLQVADIDRRLHGIEEQLNLRSGGQVVPFQRRGA
jgi:hypothetical protein